MDEQIASKIRRDSFFDRTMISVFVFNLRLVEIVRRRAELWREDLVAD
jgi:hypothetical protein